MKKLGLWLGGILAALVIAVGGVLVSRGFHHGLKMWHLLSRWNSQPQTDFQISIQARDLQLDTDGFWLDDGQSRIYGLDLDGAAIYVQGQTVALDNGRAYALPQWEPDDEQLRQLLLAALAGGKITAQGDSYHLSLADAGISATLIADGDAIAAISVQAQPDLTLHIKSAQPREHTLSDAVRTALAHPASVPLMQPLEPLLPAVTDLMARESVSGVLGFSVECGVLSLQEELELTYAKSDGVLHLQRGSIQIPVNLADFDLDFPPAALPLLLLRDGTFTVTDNLAQYHLTLQPQTARELFCALIPEIAELDFTFTQCTGQLSIRDGKLDTIQLSGGGEVPFLITTVPITVSVDISLH